MKQERFGKRLTIIEHGAEENIWMFVGGSGGRLEKTA
jgi:hypothetical protein